MKELSIEEKAKAYDEVIERAKKVLLDCTPEEQKVVEYISPELKESEGERIRKALVQFFKEKDEEDFEGWVPKVKVLAWLEKQGEQKPAWSEEDEEKFNEVIDFLDYKGHKTDIEFLNSLKDRVQPKQEWSEEDERIYKVILELMDSYSKGTIGGYIISPNTDRYIKWFKSLKERCSWRPSDEQVRAIDVVRGISNRYSNDTLKALKSLYNDLKKLRRNSYD